MNEDSLVDKLGNERGAVPVATAIILGAGTLTGWLSAGFLWVEVIAQAEVLTGNAPIPVLSLLAFSVSGLTGIITKGFIMLMKGDLVQKSLLEDVVATATEKSIRATLKKFKVPHTDVGEQ